MTKLSRPMSLLDRPPTQNVSLESRPSSLNIISGSVKSFDNIHYQDSMETLVSAHLPAADHQAAAGFNPSTSPYLNHGHGTADRPYATGVAWNSSTTLRRTSSHGSLKSKWDLAADEREDRWASWQGDENDKKYEEGDTQAIKIRYALMMLHTSLLVVKLAHTVYLRDPLLLILILLKLIAFLIYIPAAFGLSLARKGSHFDHAGGEVAYLVVQTVLWTFSTYWALDMLIGTDCSEEWDWFEKGVYAGIGNNKPYCTNQGVSGGISLLHSLVLFGWAAWVVWLVVKRGKEEPGKGGIRRCFQVSTHWLLRGWPITGGISGPPY